MVMAGKVFANGQRLDKPGKLLDPAVQLRVLGVAHPWVSRGGIKLAHALDQFGLSPQGLVCLDVGASTGGFTDVLLQRGARRVYAVDVGRGQLDWSLRNNPQVIVLERTNARYLSRVLVVDPIDLIVCDASFIGLEVIMPAPLALAAPKAALVALIKPQFEVGKEKVGKGGVVRDPALHEAVCIRIRAWLEHLGWRVLEVTESPVKGAKGNREFLIAARLEIADVRDS